MKQLRDDADGSGGKGSAAGSKRGRKQNDKGKKGKQQSGNSGSNGEETISPKQREAFRTICDEVTDAVIAGTRGPELWEHSPVFDSW